MSARHWAIATGLFGVLTLAVFVAFALLPEMAAARACLAPGSVIQFELARSAADLAAIFGAPGSECRTLAIAAMDAVNTLDLLAFIPAYALFCISGAIYLSGSKLLRPLTVAAIGAVVLAAAADYLETKTLLALTQSLDNPAPLLPYSHFGAWAKFALLAAHALFCAGLAHLARPSRSILATLLILPTFGVAAAAYNQAALTSLLNASFALAWLALWGFALRAAVRVKGAPA